MCNEVDELLAERGVRYGEFDELAEISQNLKVTIGSSGNFNELDADQQESLEMIAHKIARILNGDPNYVDSWADIAGYAQLVAQRLERDTREAEDEIEAARRGVSHKKIKKAFKVLRQAGILNQTA